MKKTIAGRKFANQDIRLDGKYFQQCSFDNCVFRFGAEDAFGFEECSFSGGTRVDFDNHAAMMLAGLSMLYASGFAEDVENLFRRVRQFSATVPGQGKQPN